MTYTTSIFAGHIEDIASRIQDRIIDMVNYPCKVLFIKMDRAGLGNLDRAMSGFPA